VNRYAGEAVLQGSNVYAPGLLAASSGLAAGDMVAVTVAVEQQAG
jgi:predicted ribosome-associated RNA-binding protein Tma20